MECRLFFELNPLQCSQQQSNIGDCLDEPSLKSGSIDFEIKDKCHVRPKLFVGLKLSTVLSI